MAKKVHVTPMLDELENGPWPSFISGIKRLRDEHGDERINGVTEFVQSEAGVSEIVPVVRSQEAGDIL